MSVKQVEASAVFAVATRFHRQIRTLAALSGTHEMFICDSGVGCRSQTRVPVAAKWAGGALVRNAVDDAD